MPRQSYTSHHLPQLSSNDAPELKKGSTSALHKIRTRVSAFQSCEHWEGSILTTGPAAPSLP